MKPFIPIDITGDWLTDMCIWYAATDPYDEDAPEVEDVESEEEPDECS